MRETRMREFEILRSDTPPEDETLFGIAQNDRRRRLTLTLAIEGGQEVGG